MALVEVDAVDDALDRLVERRSRRRRCWRPCRRARASASCRVPASSRWIALPTSVEPVNATLSTSGCSTSAAPVEPSPVTMLTTPGGSSAWRQTSAKSSAVSGVVSAGLSTTVLPQRERRRDLPGQHQQREVPRDDLAGDAERPRAPVRERVLELVGPAGVVEEVRGGERQVDVARLLDRLAAVERLEHRELARALLEQRARSGRGTSRARPGAAPTSRPRTRSRAARDGERRRPRRPPARPPRAAPRSAGEIVVNHSPRARLDQLAADEEAVALLERDDRRAPRARARTPTRGATARGSRGSSSPSQSMREVVAGSGSAPVRCLRICISTSLSSDEAPKRKQVGRQPVAGRASRGARTRYWIACFAVRMPPAGFIPTTRPVSSWTSRIASSMHERDRQRRGRADLAGRGLDEVGAGRHREQRRAADVVVGAELAGLEDHLQVRRRRTPP